MLRCMRVCLCVLCATSASFFIAEKTCISAAVKYGHEGPENHNVDHSYLYNSM